MQLYDDKAIVLRTQKLGEADRIITMLGSEHGPIRAVAKGVRKPTSKLGGRLEPFTAVAVQIRRGRSLDIVVGAEILRAYADPISRDYDSFAAGAGILETAEALAASGADQTQYRLLRGAVGALARGAHRPELIRDSYILRALAVGGWAPRLDRCVRCGGDAPLRYFSASLGGLLCAECAVTASSPLLPETVELLRGLADGDWAAVDPAAALPRAEASGVIREYLQFVLERRIRSLTTDGAT